MNYLDLFRVTLPETVLEIAALLVIVVDLLVLRNSLLKTRVLGATVVGVLGCVAALFALPVSMISGFSLAGTGFRFGGSLLLAQGGYVTVAQAGILVLTALTLLLLIEEKFTKHIGEYVAVVLMAAAGGLVVAAAQDLLVIFVGLELLSLGLYILTAFAKTSGKSAEAALKYYLFGGMSAAFMLFGFSYLYGIAGSTNISKIMLAIVVQGPSPLLYAGWVLVVAGLAFKVAAVPFHLWAPDTYEGAPAPAAAFIASASKVASFALLITICRASVTISGKLLEGNISQKLDVFNGTMHNLTGLLLLLAAVSMVVGNLAALAQTSVRRLLAYSAIAHAGYMLLGVATRSGSAASCMSIGDYFSSIINAQGPVLYYVLTYGLTTIGAFGVVGVIERATGSDKIDNFSGLHKRNPLLAGVLLILILSLAGIPPLVGFWAKFNLFIAVLNLNNGATSIAMVALAVAMSAVSLYYYLQVLKRAYVAPAVDETPIKMHPLTTLVLVLITLTVVVMGCLPTLLQNWIVAAYQ